MIMPHKAKGLDEWLWFITAANDHSCNRYDYRTNAALRQAVILELLSVSYPAFLIVRETADSFTDFASSEGYRLCMQIEPQLFYKGDEYAIRQLVSVLLDNAVKYALPGETYRRPGSTVQPFLPAGSGPRQSGRLRDRTFHSAKHCAGT